LETPALTPAILIVLSIKKGVITMDEKRKWHKGNQ